MFLSLKTLYRKRTVIWPFYFYTIIRTLSGKKFKVIATSGLVAKEIRSVCGMHYVDFADIRGEVERTGDAR